MLDTKKVGKQIQRLRAEHHMNQDALAEKLYVSRQAISLWESGKGMPSIDNLICLTEIFEVSFEEILCLKVKGGD